MIPRVLLDTGPLVAYLDRRDRFHEWAVAQWDRLPPPLLTCEAVLTEACFLVRRLPGGAATVLELLAREVVRLHFDLSENAEPIARLLRRYSDVPMSLADACLVRMAEDGSGRQILTVDQDFRLYRMHGRNAIPLLMPPAS